LIVGWKADQERLIIAWKTDLGIIDSCPENWQIEFKVAINGGFHVTGTEIYNRGQYYRWGL
jgi:hypothetical protein